MVALCKRRGFVFASAEIYGGFANTYDYGPLGVLLKNNVRDAWIRANVQMRDDMELLDAALITSPRVWVASATSKSSTIRSSSAWANARAATAPIRSSGANVPELRRPAERAAACSTPCSRRRLGPVPDEDNIAYLPPETAQGMFVNFVNVATTMRRKLPFGIAQVRKSFQERNYAGQFRLPHARIRADGDRVFRRARHRRGVVRDLGRRRANAGTSIWASDPKICAATSTRAEKLSHYSKRTVDIEYRFPFGEGWGELEGIANRSKGPDGTSWDLWQHEQASGQRLTLFDEQTKQHVRPGVVEPAAGLTRAALTFLIDAYEEQVLDAAKNDVRTVLHLHPALAPYKACVVPLFRNKPDLVKAARGDLRRSAAALDDHVRLGQQHRQAVSPPGRDRHAVLHHGRLPDARGSAGHHPRPRQHGPVAIRPRADRRAARLARGRRF